MMTVIAPTRRTVQRTAVSRSAHRCVVIGAGSVGRRHLHNLTALGVQAAALRTNRGQNRSRDEFPSLHSWEEVRVFGPTLAVVANPTAFHALAAVQAAQLGCHVLIEKPVTDRLQSARDVAGIVEERRITVLVGYQYRFHPTLRVVRGWLNAGVIGEPLSAQAHWGEFLPGWHPGEDHRLGYSARKDLGGGVVLTLSHPVDYVRWLLGEVRDVSAMTAQRTGHTVDVDDIASMTLRLESGVLATITLDYAEQPPRHELRVVGREGSLHWDATTGVARAWRAPSGHELVATPEPDFQRNSMFVAELEHFLECADGRAQPQCSLNDGVRAVAIVEAALRSAALGRVIHA